MGQPSGRNIRATPCGAPYPPLYWRVCFGNIGVLVWATSRGRNCLNHSLAQVAYSAPIATDYGTYPYLCARVRDSMVRDFACRQGAPRDCAIWRARIFSALGLSPGDFQVCVFREAKRDCVVRGRGLGVL